MSAAEMREAAAKLAMSKLEAMGLRGTGHIVGEAILGLPLPDEGGVAGPREAAWGDPDVQVIYELLCDDMNPPEGEHWEGWVATRIATRLRAINGGEP